MKKKFRIFFALIIFFWAGSLLAQSAETSAPVITLPAQASQPADSDGVVLRYDANAKLFRWLEIGGNPIVRGGVPTKEKLVEFANSTRFQKIMDNLGVASITADGQTIDQVKEARDLVNSGNYGYEILAPNTSRGLFLKMAVGSGKAEGVRIIGPVLWAGNHPIDIWVLRLKHIRVDIPKDCANVGLTTLYQERERVVEKIVEKSVPVPVEKIVEKIVEKPVQCDPNYSFGLIGEYPTVPGKHGWVGKKQRLDPSFINFPPSNNPVTQQRLQLLRTEIITRITEQDHDFFLRKVKSAQVWLNVCTGMVLVRWSSDGFHWKEFWIGFGVGFGAGLLVGDLIHPSSLAKLDFKPPDNIARPATKTAVSLMGKAADLFSKVLN